jgi:hypothetical protein
MAERGDYKLRQSQLAQRRWDAQAQKDMPGHSQDTCTRVETEDESKELNTINSINLLDANTESSLDDIYFN